MINAVFVFFYLSYFCCRDADKRKQLVKAEKKEDNTDKASTVSGETAAKGASMVNKDGDQTTFQNTHRRRVN